MALSYNLYQIGFVADADTTVSYVQDSGLSLASSLPAEEEGYGANDSEQIIELSGSSSNLNNSFTTQYDSVYIIVGGELIFASLPDGGSDTQLSVNRRGNSGTPVESHNAGETIYQVDPQRKDDVTVNTSLRRIKDITDFSVEDVGQFEEAVEYEKGTFRVSNVSATVSGIDRHTLSDAGDIDKPWVFEVRDSGNSLLFQGILKDDAKFNAGTEKINFTAVSWLEILNRVESLPARVQYEADIKAVTVGDPTGEVSSDLTIQFPSSPKFTSNFPSRGDTVAVETEKGEIRKVATKVKQDTDFTNVKIPVDGLFENLVYSSKGTSNQVKAGKVEEYQTFSGTAYYSEYRFKNLPTELKNTLTELSNPDKYKVLLFDSNDSIVEQISINKGLVNEDPFNEEWPKVFAIDRRTIVQPEIPSHQYFIIAKNTGSQALLDKVSSAEAENKVKILSQEMWGYEGIDDSDDNDGLPDYFDPQGLMDALFKTQEVTYGGDYDGRLPTLRLGVLPKIMQSNGVVFGRGGPDDVFETIDPRVEFPTAPIEALRMIQQDTGTMLTVNTGTTTNAEGETLPSVQFEILPRQRLLDDANRVQLEDVTDWNENTSERDVRAVVIEPNNQYGAGGDDQPEYLGIYTEQMDRNFSLSGGETDFGSNGVPEGDDVITIKTNHFPKGGGYTYREGDDPVVNDDHLREIARLYYKQFTEANRKVEFSVGKDNPDVLAKYVSIEEGRVVDDSVLVTQKRHYLEEDHRETSLVGRIGGRAQFGETAPVPDIRVPRAFRADSSDVATILVSGRNSYDGRPGTLSFQWEYKKVSASTWTSGGTGAVLEEDITFTGGGSPVTYDVRLTVTNNNTGASAQETDQFVIKPYNEPDDTTPSNEIDYDKQQVTDSGNQYGRINVTLANPELVQTDSNGNPLFEFRAAQGAEIDGSASWYRVGSGNSSEGSGQVVTDGNGNVTGFFAEVQLDTKHVSNIQTRIKWTETVGYANQVRSHAFDFDSVAEVDVSVYNDESGTVYADVSGDEDTDTFDVEYRKNDGDWQSVLTSQGSDIVGYEVVAGSNVNDGDSIDVRITPFNFDGVEGKQVLRATFYNRSTGGGSELDSLVINGAGTIDSINTGEFRFLDTGGNDAAVIDTFGLQVDKINGVSIDKYARTDQSETFSQDVTVQGNLTVNGTEFVTNTETVEIQDNLAIINNGEAGSGITEGFSGWEVDRGTLTDYFFGFDEERDRFVVGEGTTGRQVVATREDPNNVTPDGIAVFNSTANRFDTEQQGSLGTVNVDKVDGYDAGDLEPSEGANITVGTLPNPTIAVSPQGENSGLNAGQLHGYTGDKYPRKAENASIGGSWSFSDTVTLNGTTLKTQGAGTGFSSSGVIIDDVESWFEDLQVRGSLIAREFELRKITVTKGDHVFGPGGGKIEEVTGFGPYTLTFAEPSGLQPDDLCLIQESSLSDGDRTIIKKVELFVDSTANQTKEVTVSVNGTGTPEKGDDVVVVGSQTDTTRDSSVFLSPYGPFIDTLDGINSFTDWSNRSPNARFGKIDGAPDLSAGPSPSGHGLWGSNVYLEGTIVANSGEIADSVTVGGTNASDLASSSEIPESSVTIRASSAPSSRPSGEDIQKGDIWIDTTDTDGDGEGEDIPHTYDGTDPYDSSGWIQSYTSIDGGFIKTGKVAADRINVGGIKIGDLEDDGTYATESSVTIRSTTAPKYRDSGDPVQEGDTWIDTTDLNGDGEGEDIPHTYKGDTNGSYDSSQWVRAFTSIDGATIRTGTVQLDRLSFANSTEGYIDAQYLNINADDLEINSNTTFFGGSGIPATALEDDYTESGTENVTITGTGVPDASTKRPFDSDNDGTNDDPIEGDFYIDTGNGDKPYVYRNGGWIAAYTKISGGDITTGTVDAGRIDVDGIFATDAQVKSTLTIGSSSTSGVIQSYNFSDTEGWQITNQTATFQDGKFRGTFNVESGTLSDLTVTGQLTFPSSYDSSQIRIGSGSNAFFVGDFSLSGSGQGSGFPQVSDSVTDSIAGGGAVTGGGLGDYNDFGIGGASVTVDVPWDSNATSSGNLNDNIDGDTGVELTVYVREKDAGTLVQERKKEVFAVLNDSGTASFSFTANSSTDEIEVETDLYANLGADEEFYSDVSISNQDADVDWTNQQDFVGPDGIKYRDGNSNTMFEIDGNDTYDFGNHLNNAHRVTVQEGSIVLKDSNGTKQIVIHPDGYIDFKQQGSGSTNGSDFPTPPSGWVRLGAESNDRKLARKSGNGSANDF